MPEHKVDWYDCNRTEVLNANYLRWVAWWDCNWCLGLFPSRSTRRGLYWWIERHNGTFCYCCRLVDLAREAKTEISTYTNTQVPRVSFSYSLCTKKKRIPWNKFWYPLCKLPYKSVSQFVILFWIYTPSITWKWQARRDVEGGVHRLSYGNMPECFLNRVGETRNNFILDIRYAVGRIAQSV